MKSCANCRFFIALDAHKAMMDPAAKFMICGWKPIQPFWMAPAYQPHERGILNAAAIRKPNDGATCETWEVMT